ncbi:hypothetical protein HYH02_000852 [Chlamydomonas schloesseri]|uniref:SP-RING-type domain-containing protein n=1 Tax=Chlamydomonas schloesseri TaxID=2026947 RepID=A0A835WX35_9CHLO|nr:hypothetical protein HYH02_000852 [Chlamydomonas schloesseri]|eukprot:KAG2455027.1 hypothetical protein HYH02_000852 [Chlamydomonas schloesseri]
MADERPAKRSRSLEHEPQSVCGGFTPAAIFGKPAAAETTTVVAAVSTTGVTTANGKTPLQQQQQQQQQQQGSQPTIPSRVSSHSGAGSSRAAPHPHAPQSKAAPAPGLAQLQPAPGSLQWLLQRQQQQQQQQQAVATMLAPIPEWAQAALDGLDAFWVPTATLAVLVTQPTGPAPGSHGQLQCVSAMFTVPPAALADIAERRAQARLVCVQPEDAAAAAAGAAAGVGLAPAAGAGSAAAAPTSLPPVRRIHMYGGSHVVLNGRPYEVTKEDRIDLLLEPNQADQAVDLSSGLRAGVNQLSLFWPVGVAGGVAVLRLCRGPLTAQEVLAGAGPGRLAPPLPLPLMVAHLRARLEPVDMEAEAEPEEGAGHGQGGGAGGQAEDKTPAAQRCGSAETDGGGTRNQASPGSTSESPAQVPPPAATAIADSAAALTTTVAATTSASAPPATTSASAPPATTSASAPPATTSASAPPATTSASAPPAADAHGRVSISLRCPLSGGVVVRPGHLGATAATHPLAFFDLPVFLEQARATGCWACPATGMLGSIHDLRPHAYLSEVMRTLDANGVPRGKVEAIDVLPCGRWRPRDSRVPFLEVPLPLPLSRGVGAEAGRAGADAGVGVAGPAEAGGAVDGVVLPPPPRFDVRLLDPEEEDGRDVVDLTDD